MQNFPPTTNRDGVDFSEEDVKSYPHRLESVKRLPYSETCASQRDGRYS